MNTATQPTQTAADPFKGPAIVYTCINKGHYFSLSNCLDFLTAHGVHLHADHERRALKYKQQHPSSLLEGRPDFVRSYNLLNWLNKLTLSADHFAPAFLWLYDEVLKSVNAKTYHGLPALFDYVAAVKM